MSSPQFLSLAISKSNRLLAVNCFCCSICVVAACLQSCCNFLSSGNENVADNPILKLLFAFISVRTGFSQITCPGLSGIPSPTTTSCVITISAPSSHHLSGLPSPSSSYLGSLGSVLTLVSYQDSQG